MSDETEDKDKDKADEPTSEESFTNIIDRFTGIIQKFKIKNSAMVADHCAKGNLEDLEDVEARLREMGVHPSLVNQVLNFWADEINTKIPNRLRKKLEKETGAKGREPSEDEEGEKYAVDSETGIIRLAKESEKAISLADAKVLQKIVKKDLKEQEERESGSKKEPAFVVDGEGAWTLNPKARIGFGEFAVFQMYQESLKKGEPIDPVEELAKREEASVRLREALGGKTKGEDSELSVLDKLNALGLLKKSGGDEGITLTQLDALGLLKKPGDEGRGTQIDLLDKLDSLGMLKKTGESEGSEIVRALQTEVKGLKDALQKQEMDAIKGAVGSLAKGLEELRKDLSDKGTLEGRYALLKDAMSHIDTQVTGFRGDVKPILMNLTGGGGGESGRKSPQEKARVAKGLKEAVALEKEAKGLEDELLFGGKSQG